MKSNKAFHFLSIMMFCSILFSSCLSVDRSIVLNKDGSGTETMKITFSKVFYETMASMTFLMDSSRVKGFMDSLYSDEVFINDTKDKYSSVPGVKLIDIYSNKNDDLSNSFIVKYEFDSVQKLSSSVLSKFDSGNKSEPDSEIKSDSKPDTEVLFTMTGDKVLFSYIYVSKEQNLSEIEKDTADDQMNKNVADMFKDGQVSFEIQFPYDVISSNATTANGNTLIWKYSLSESIDKGNMKLEAVMKSE